MSSVSPHAVVVSKFVLCNNLFEGNLNMSLGVESLALFSENCWKFKLPTKTIILRSFRV